VRKKKQRDPPKTQDRQTHAVVGFPFTEVPKREETKPHGVGGQGVPIRRTEVSAKKSERVTPQKEGRPVRRAGKRQARYPGESKMKKN